MKRELARSAVISAVPDEPAIEWAKRRLLELMGRRGWNDTHESMMARVGKQLAMNPRRVRAIIQQERHTKVSGDEVLAIQRAFEALERISALARAADDLAHPSPREAGAAPVPAGRGNSSPK